MASLSSLEEELDNVSGGCWGESDVQCTNLRCDNRNCNHLRQTPDYQDINWTTPCIVCGEGTLRVRSWDTYDGETHYAYTSDDN